MEIYLDLGRILQLDIMMENIIDNFLAPQLCSIVVFPGVQLAVLVYQEEQTSRHGSLQR